ncbi:MAG: sulfatase-like hydrolase/transferase [Planctomycetes bacterium]|nr:sulfatase-like hydrolase/transferase [Planctomycetota bacterium]
MTKRHAICIVVDGLRASALGTYGNTISPTPHLDAFASRSLVADWLWADSPSLAGFYRSVWNCTHALRPVDDALQTAVLDALQQRGVRQWLVTDDPWLTSQSSELPFDDDLLIETQATQAADEIENTIVSYLLSETVERLAEWQEDNTNHNASSLLWLHTRGLTGPWDAPQSMRTDLLDEGDPAAADFIAPPSVISGIEDPDTIFSHKVAYSAQVAVVDACLGAFYQALEQLFAGTETLVILLGSRGLALGEHGSIGTDCQALFSEQLHLPLIVNVCGNSTPVARHPGLVQPADVGTTLLEWFGAETDSPLGDGTALLANEGGEQGASRKLAVSVGSTGELAIRTPAWMLRVPPRSDSTEQGDAVELYAKPDDRWEFNDVADRCPEVVEQLCEELNRYTDRSRAGESLPLEPLEADLLDPIR